MKRNKITNTSGVRLEFFIKKEGLDDILISLGPDEVSFSDGDEMTKSMRIFLRKNLLKIDSGIFDVTPNLSNSMVVSDSNSTKHIETNSVFIFDNKTQEEIEKIMHDMMQKPGNIFLSGSTGCTFAHTTDQITLSNNKIRIGSTRLSGIFDNTKLTPEEEELYREINPKIFDETITPDQEDLLNDLHISQSISHHSILEEAEKQAKKYKEEETEEKQYKYNYTKKPGRKKKRGPKPGAKKRKEKEEKKKALESGENNQKL